VVRALVRDSIDNHDDDPRLLRVMVEEATVSRELVDAVERHGKLRTAEVRDVIVRHPDVHVGDPEVAAELVLLTVEMNTHKFMAGPRSTPVETFEEELVAMVTLYLRGDPRP
jgi:hypothetical protein